MDWMPTMTLGFAPRIPSPADRAGEPFSGQLRLLPYANLQERGGVSDQTDVLQGTLDLLIMKTIALEPMHGWAIAQRIQQISDELLRVQQGSLYPALHRLEHQGWITADWGASENNRRARFYSLTKAGRRQLAVEVSKWERLSAGVNLVLHGT
jgi:PadR family transcriptional regulator, regulatory protein PadR